MNNNKLKFFPVYLTSRMTANVIDCFRSIYFSLFGSSMLTLSLKFSTLSTDSAVLFVVGVSAFLLGLFVSVAIASRFKRNEKNYDSKLEKEKLEKEPEVFYYENETNKTTVNKVFVWIEHFLFWIIWIPAVICVGYAAYHAESKSAKSSAETNAVISNIDTKVQQLETELQKISSNDLEKKQLKDLLKATQNEVDQQKKEIEVLKKTKKTP